MAKIELDASSLDNSFEKRLGDGEEKIVKPVVSTGHGLITAKPGPMKKLKKAFISEDMKDVTDYIFLDIIVPGIKNAILDTLERIFFNSSRHGGSKRRDDSYYGKVSYSSYYNSRGSRDNRDRRRERDRDDEIGNVDYRNIIVEKREDAEEIVRQLRGDIREYDSVSVAKLLDLIGEAGKYTDNSYGWTREEDIGVRRVREGYLIDVREAEFIGD